MGFRGFFQTLALLAALSAVLSSCSSEPSDVCSDVGVVRQPFTRKCLAQSFDPITDESSPNYGRVGCQLLSAFDTGSKECACDAPGFAPVTAEQRAFASARLTQDQACKLACCADLCFCGLLQHSGDALAACQSRASEGTYEGSASGWCYVEPALGLGTDPDVADCPADAKRLIRYYPYDARYNIFAVLSCVSDT